MENLHKKKEAGPALRKCVTFTKTQTKQRVKRLRIDQGRELGIHKLHTWQAEKDIKIEFIVTYSLKMHSIAEKTNSLIISKACCLLLDSNMDHSF